MSDDSSWGRILLGSLVIAAGAAAWLFWPLLNNTPYHQAEVAIDDAVWSCEHQRGYYYYQRLWDAQKAISKLETAKQPKLSRELDVKITKAGCSLKTPEQETKEEQDRWEKEHGSGASPDLEDYNSSPSDNSTETTEPSGSGESQ